MPDIKLHFFLNQLSKLHFPYYHYTRLSSCWALCCPVAAGLSIDCDSPLPRPSAVSLRCEPSGDGRSLEMRTAPGGFEVRTVAAKPSQARTTFDAPHVNGILILTFAEYFVMHAW